MRGRGLLCREAPSLALPPEETVQDGTGGEAASLREAPLPQTPFPEEWLGIGLYVSADLRAHATCGWSPISLVVVTAADRAAATFVAWGTNPSARISRAPPLSGEALFGFPPKGSLHRGGCQRFTIPLAE